MKESLAVQGIIERLHLEPHIEGGYFRRTYTSDKYTSAKQADSKYCGTSIYYMLTAQSPIGHLHCNKSDIIHYFHSGSPIQYTLVNSDGELTQVIMGNDVTRGELPQLLVKGGVWKASQLVGNNNSADYSLISEAVIPGFDYKDMQLATDKDLNNHWPQHTSTLQPLIKSK